HRAGSLRERRHGQQGKHEGERRQDDEKNTIGRAHDTPRYRAGVDSPGAGVADPLSSADAPATMRPSGNVTRRASIRRDPSFARYPSTMSVSPILISLFLNPRRDSAPGEPPSQVHSATLPPSSFTSRWKYECGLVHSIRV